jgi:H+/gluconate symporter-like permease
VVVYPRCNPCGGSVEHGRHVLVLAVYAFIAATLGTVVYVYVDMWYYKRKLKNRSTT